MKKILSIVCIILVAFVLFGFAACGDTSNVNEKPGEETNKFTGITFEDKTFVYDGKEHTLEISGTLPTGAKVVYENNSGTNAGTYEATATVTCENYETLELTATLTISKAKFTDITLEDKTFIYDGKSHSLEVVGTLPANTNVTYENNEQTEGGSYTVKATLTNPNYETLELTAKLNIRTLADAKAIVDKILKRPETWNFMPEGLREESMAYSEMPVTQFSGNYVNVNSIGKQFIGKQMNVVYDILGNSQSVLEKADFVFAAGEAIAAVYQTFINGNPDDYNSFSGSIEVGGINCSLAIELQGEVSVLTLGNNTVNVRLSADSANKYKYRQNTVDRRCRCKICCDRKQFEICCRS